MDKFAQKRTFLNKLKEKTNLSGMAAEKFFNKEFAEAMNGLRKADDNVRKTMLGDISGLPAFQTKELLAQVASSLKTREYVDAFTQLGSIHSQFMSIKSEIENLKSEFSKVHEDLLLKNFKEDDKMSFEEKNKVIERRKNLAELQKRLAISANNQFIKQAFLGDFFKNVGTERGRALAAWEKRYASEVAKWRDGTGRLLDAGKNIYKSMIDQLKVMAKARATRNIDDYINAAGVFMPAIADFNKDFKKYYQDAMLPLLKKLELDNPGVVPSETTAPSDPAVKSLQNQEVVSPAAITAPQPVVLEPASDTLRNPDVISKYIREEALEKAQTNQLSSLDDTESPLTLRSASHAQFYRILEKFASEKPSVLKKLISGYAKKIASSDSKTSVKLLKIASNIKAGK